MPTFMAGLLDSFTQGARASRKEEADRLAKQEEREFNTLKLLAEQSGDDEIRNAAATALLEMATGVSKRPKRGYLANLIGAPNEMAHPAVARVMALAKTPQAVTDTIPVYGPGRVPAPSPTAQGSMAMPAKPLGQGGGPATPAELGGPPPPPPSLADMGVPAVGTGLPPSYLTAQQRVGSVTHTRMQPRHLFLTPFEQARQTAAAKSAGDVEGEVAGLIAAGFDETEARGLIKEKYERAARMGAGNTWAEGEIYQKPGGEWVQRLYLRSDPTKWMEQPAMAPALKSTRTVAQDEQDAAEMFGNLPEFHNVPPALILQRLTPDQRTQLYAMQSTRLTQGAGARAGAAAAAQQNAINAGQLGKPIGVTAGAEQGVPPTTTLGEFTGVVPVTQDQRQRLEAANNLGNQMTEIERLTKTVFPNQSGLLGGLTAAAVIGTKRLRRDPDLAALEAAVGLSLANMARVLQNERGTLNEGDIKRAQDALTKLQVSLTSGDTQESALARLQIVRAAITKVQQTIQMPAQQGVGRGGTPPGPPPGPPPAGAPPAGGPPAAAAGGAQPGRRPAPRPPTVPPAADEWTGQVFTDPQGQDWGKSGNTYVALELYTTPDNRLAWRVKK